MSEIKSSSVSMTSPLYGTLLCKIDDQGREYFRASDICVALGVVNVTETLTEHVDLQLIVKFDSYQYLTEPGLYQLVFALKTDWAKGFVHWLFDSVIPQLRASSTFVSGSTQEEESLDHLSDIQLLKRYIHRRVMSGEKPLDLLYRFRLLETLNKD